MGKKLNSEQKRELDERLEGAKRELLRALRLAESFGAKVDTIKALGRLCGLTETLQRKII